MKKLYFLVFTLLLVGQANAQFKMEGGVVRFLTLCYYEILAASNVHTYE